jgi:hypothetical protein
MWSQVIGLAFWFMSTMDLDRSSISLILLPQRREGQILQPESVFFSLKNVLLSVYKRTRVSTPPSFKEPKATHDLPQG